MSKTKFEQELECAAVDMGWRDEDMEMCFIDGALWGADHKMKRAEKLIKDIKEVFIKVEDFEAIQQVEELLVAYEQGEK